MYHHYDIHVVRFKENEPVYSNNNKSNASSDSNAFSNDSDQPGHQNRLIRVFTLHMETS